MCGYCGAKGYLVCTTCFPDTNECKYAIFSPDNGKDCLAKHVLGVSPEYTMKKLKKDSGNDAHTSTRATPIPPKQAQARAAGSKGGKMSQEKVRDME